MTLVVLDTSFLLPFLGIRVKDVNHRVLERIEELIVERREMRLCYHELMLPELIAKAFSTSIKRGLEEVPREVIEGFLNIASGIFIEVLATTREDLSIAYALRLAGHSDFFDCIAYAAAKARGGVLLTLDRNLKESVKKAGLDTGVIIGQEEFLALTKPGSSR